jgi:hypothetical protein
MVTPHKHSRNQSVTRNGSVGIKAGIRTVTTTTPTTRMLQMRATQRMIFPEREIGFDGLMIYSSRHTTKRDKRLLLSRGTCTHFLFLYPEPLVPDLNRETRDHFIFQYTKKLEVLQILDDLNKSAWN